MAAPLKILLVEDNSSDAELMLMELRDGGLNFVIKRVETEQAYLDRLAEGVDVVISDHQLPHFSGLRALELLQAHGLDVPFILVSGTIGEDLAVDAMRRGAHDYLLKDRLTRLVPAVKNALAENRLRAERKRADMALRESEALLRMVTSEVHVGLALVDTERRYLFANPAYHDLLGLDPKLELVGKRVSEVLAPVYDQIRPRMDRAFLEERVSYELSIPSLADGDQSCYAVTYEPRIRAATPHVVVVIVDITERRKAEATLQENEARFRQLTENIQEVFWLVDIATQQWLYISPAFETIWGRSCQSLYRDPTLWQEAIHPEDREHVARAAREKTTGGYDVQYRIVRLGGGVRWIQDRAFPIQDATGRVYRVAGVAEDITRRKELEQQYQQSQKMEAIGQLAGGVAHDFNNILAIIQMQTALLKMDGRLSPTQSELIHEISAAADRASTLTRQLLLFSRRQMMRARDLNLNETIAGLTQMLRRVLGEDIQIESILDPAALLVHADDGMIDQVLMNLAVNARDAMSSGGKLTIVTAAVDFAGPAASASPQARAGSFACLSVTDTGCGIPPEIRSRIFEPFFTTKAEGKGTGLGLATVFSIMEQHRGWLEVETEVGQGTTFRVYFPRLAGATKKLEPTKSGGYVSGGSETILLVEDDSSVRKLARLLLENFGYRVREASTGPEAISTWKEHRHEIRLLLTDMVMPGGMSGRQIAAHLLELDPHLRVIYSSGYSVGFTDKDFVLEEGVNFVAKPFQAGLMLKTVRACLDRKVTS